MPKPGLKIKTKSDFYKKYGFDIGDKILILPKNDGRSLNHFNNDEFDDLLSRAQKGVIKSASECYGTISKNGVEGPFYKKIHIECEDGDEIICHPIYYRLYGRFDCLGLNKKPIKTIIPKTLRKAVKNRKSK